LQYNFVEVTASEFFCHFADFILLRIYEISTVNG